jgi:hypothetical protein
MRTCRPQPGPSDPIKTPAQPGGGAARPDIEGEHAATGSVPSRAPKPHPSLTAMARLLGRQVAREAADTGGSNG